MFVQYMWQKNLILWHKVSLKGSFTFLLQSSWSIWFIIFTTFRESSKHDTWKLTLASVIYLCSMFFYTTLFLKILGLDHQEIVSSIHNISCSAKVRFSISLSLVSEIFKWSTCSRLKFLAFILYLDWMKPIRVHFISVIWENDLLYFTAVYSIDCTAFGGTVFWTSKYVLI